MTRSGGPRTGDDVPRSQEAIDRASAKRDATREAQPTKVRLLPEYIEALEAMARALKLEGRAPVVYQLIDDVIEDVAPAAAKRLAKAKEERASAKR